MTLPIFDLRDLNIVTHNNFDGSCNYYNPTQNLCGKRLYREQFIYNDSILLSNIIDVNNNSILHHSEDEDYIYSYEDARFIHEDEISVCVHKIDKRKLNNTLNVSVEKYNIVTNTFTKYRTQNSHFEKHWQFIDDKIIYHVSPYTIMDTDEKIIIEKHINMSYWKQMYGMPGLSTNIFDVYDRKCLLFHSYIQTGHLSFKYYIGLMLLSDDYIPYAYMYRPLFEGNREYTDHVLYNDMCEWRRKAKMYELVNYEVIFPMNVVVDETNINIYAGINDCEASNIIIPLDIMIHKIVNEPCILL